MSSPVVPTQGVKNIFPTEITFFVDTLSVLHTSVMLCYEELHNSLKFIHKSTYTLKYTRIVLTFWLCVSCVCCREVCVCVCVCVCV